MPYTSLANKEPAGVPVTCRQVLTDFPEFATGLTGSDQTMISGVSSPFDAKSGHLVCCHKVDAIETALKSNAAAVALPVKFADQFKGQTDKALLASPNPELLMALVVNKYFQATPMRSKSYQGRSPQAWIADSAEVAADVTIGPFAVIGENVKIGAGSFVGANSVIEHSTTIGTNTTIHPLVYIGPRCQIGNRVEIMPNSTIGKEGFGYAHDAKGNPQRIPHQGIVVIEDDVQIGSTCSVDRATFNETRIGRFSKMDNQAHIAHNVTIGHHATLVSKFGVAGSCTIGNYFLAGGATVIGDHVNIPDGVTVAGLSGISSSIEKPGKYGGFPLLPLQQHLKMRAALTHLPEMRKQLSQLMQAIFPNQADAAHSKEAGDN